MNDTSQYDKKTVDALVEIALRHQAENDLYTFVKLAWKEVEGGKRFSGSWSAQAMCEHLEEVYYGRITRLSINIPPRCSKSTIVSVMFPVWCWIRNASLQFLTLSYMERLAIRDNVKSRRLIRSDWFQTRWGDKFSLSLDQDTKDRVDNMQGGYRVTAGLDSGITGDGGDIIICLPYESMIKTNLGEFPIGKIVEEKIQCKILSYSHSLQEVEFQEIEAYEKNDGRELYEIETEDGEIIKCTGEHPIFVEGKGYIAAKDISDGDVIWSVGRQAHEITNGREGQ